MLKPTPDPARRRHRARHSRPSRTGGRALALALAIAAALATAACHSTAPKSAPPAPPEPSPLPAAEPAPEPPEIDRLATADSAYTSGALTAAASAYEAFLAANPDGDGADRALLQLGLLYTLPDSSVADPTKGRARLRTLVQRFPVSPYSPQARSILALMDEIDRLRGDLQRQKKAAEELKKDLDALKRIDLQGQKPPG